MDPMCPELPFVIIYLDYVVVLSCYIGDQVSNLGKIFKRIAEHSLRIKLSNCHFARPRIRNIGHVIDENSVSVDPKKI